MGVFSMDDDKDITEDVRRRMEGEDDEDDEITEDEGSEPIFMHDEEGEDDG